MLWTDRRRLTTNERVGRLRLLPRDLVGVEARSPPQTTALLWKRWYAGRALAFSGWRFGAELECGVEISSN